MKLRPQSLRAWLAPSCALSVLVAVLVCAVPRLHAAPGPNPSRATSVADHWHLRIRAAQMFGRREAARSDGSVSLARLRDDLIALADSLEAAGLDSLAGEACYRAAGVATRLTGDTSVEAIARRAIRISARARDARYELQATTLLADRIGNHRPEEAVRYLESRLTRFRRAAEPVALSTAYSSLARNLAQLGRWPRSLSYSRQAVQTLARGGNRYQLAYALTQYSQSLVIAGRSREGLAMADSAVRVARAANALLPLSRALVSRSSALRATGRMEESLADLRESVARDIARGDRSHELSARGTLVGRLLEADRYREALSQADSVEARAGSELEIISIMRLLSHRATALRHLARHAEVESLLTRELPRIERYGDAIEREEDRAGTGTFVARAWVAWMHSRIDRGDVAGALALEGRSRARVFDRSIAALEPSLAALQGRLREQRAVLVAIAGASGQDGISFMVTPDSVLVHRFELAPVLEDARFASATMAGGGGGRGLEASLSRLSRALLQPSLPRIPPRTERVVVLPLAIAPDLPLEALPLDARASTRLGERYAVHVVPSSAAWMTLLSRPPSSGDVVAFGDPELGTDPSTRALMRGAAGSTLRRPLPYARAEARSVAGAHGRAWVGRAATGSRFRSEAPRAAVLHVAAHGVLIPGDAARSGLVLAGAEGLLTPDQVAGLAIRADLVALSACHGDRGPAYSGEGSLGLARAFLQAGSRSVLTTRWEVGDRAAQQMMAEFYRGLRGGLPVDESLRRARVAAARAGLSARDRFAFVLHGTGAHTIACLIGPANGR